MRSGVCMASWKTSYRDSCSVRCWCCPGFDAKITDLVTIVFTGFKVALVRVIEIKRPGTVLVIVKFVGFVIARIVRIGLPCASLLRFLLHLCLPLVALFWCICCWRPVLTTHYSKRNYQSNSTKQQICSSKYPPTTNYPPMSKGPGTPFSNVPGCQSSVWIPSNEYHAVVVGPQLRLRLWSRLWINKSCRAKVAVRYLVAFRRRGRNAYGRRGFGCRGVWSLLLEALRGLALIRPLGIEELRKWLGHRKNLRI